MSKNVLDIFKQSQKHVPSIPEPEKKEIPVREELTQDPRTAPRVHMVKHDSPLLIPNYNTLYDTFRAKQLVSSVNDIYVTGSTTTIAATEVNTAVTLTNDPQWRLDQWPKGTHLYLMIRFFSIAPTTATFVTVGAVRATFTGRAGNVVPLSVFRSNESTQVEQSAIIPSPLTDAGDRNLGTLNLFLNTGATVGDYTWQLGFMALYLLPAIKGYNVEHMIREERDI